MYTDYIEPIVVEATIFVLSHTAVYVLTWRMVASDRFTLPKAVAMIFCVLAAFVSGTLAVSKLYGLHCGKVGPQEEFTALVAVLFGLLMTTTPAPYLFARSLAKN